MLDLFSAIDSGNENRIKAFQTGVSIFVKNAELLGTPFVLKRMQFFMTKFAQPKKGKGVKPPSGVLTMEEFLDRMKVPKPEPKPERAKGLVERLQEQHEKKREVIVPPPEEETSAGLVNYLIKMAHSR